MKLLSLATLALLAGCATMHDHQHGSGDYCAEYRATMAGKSIEEQRKAAEADVLAMKKTLEDFGDAIVASVPRGRIGQPEDMAGVAVYLASRAGAYVTGAVIPVDGGMSTLV